MKRYYERKVLFDLPKDKENMKHVTLTEINPIYELYEDGTVFSRVFGRFVKTYENRNKLYYILIRAIGGSCTYSREKLVRKYIIGNITPEIEGVEHKPMLGYEGIYQIYSNGQVWSYIKNKWMTACPVKRKYLLYCLIDANGNVKTEYVHRLLAENFIVNGPLNGLEVHHKDHNQQNNSLDNLKIMAPVEHDQFHKKNRTHSPQFLAKQAIKRKIKQEEKELKKLKGRKKYTHTEKYLKKKGMI